MIEAVNDRYLGKFLDSKRTV